MSGVLPSDWRTRSYLALDFETTGLDPRRERVVEIGALRFRVAESDCPAAAGPLFAAGCAERREGYGFGSRGAGPRLLLTEEARLSALVNPGKPIPPETTAIHGIRNEDVANEPPFANLAFALTELAQGAVIVAHNAPFDLSFLEAELARAGLAAPANEVVDTRLLAKAAFPGLPSYRLVELAAALGLGHERAHRALDDARACAELFLAAAEHLAGYQDPHTRHSLLA